MDVYDIAIMPESVSRDDARHAGWCFGLPPGIRPEHWPLDPGNGYPLVHGFTVLVPDDYRCRGPDIVALSFFGTPLDMDLGEGGPFVDDDIAAVFGPGADEPTDPDLAFFWHAARQTHPRLHRLRGIVSHCAAILLTRPEYEGALCQPPPVGANRFRDGIDPPLWLQMGAAAAASNMTSETRLLRALGEPEKNVGYNRALQLRERPDDPNAGKGPRPEVSADPTGYDVGYYDAPDGTLGRHHWARRTTWMHFGGTMRPGQNIPCFSPFYLEFEEDLGGFNFAGGTAQLDLATLAFNVMRG